MGKNESAVISDFKKALRRKAEDCERHFDEFPLGPQDRFVLGDDFWATYNNFAIVESKWSEDELSSEVSKFDRVKLLCEALGEDPQMARLHAQCHRIAWRDSNNHRLMSLEYRKGVCCILFCDTCKDIDCDTKPLTVDDFAKGFFGDPPSHCLSAKEFQAYIRWLTVVITGSTREVTVLALNSDEEGYTISDEVTLDVLCKWMPSPPKKNKAKKIK